MLNFRMKNIVFSHFVLHSSLTKEGFLPYTYLEYVYGKRIPTILIPNITNLTFSYSSQPKP